MCTDADICDQRCNHCTVQVLPETKIQFTVKCEQMVTTGHTILEILGTSNGLFTPGERQNYIGHLSQITLNFHVLDLQVHV